jgi:hypothetical protein
MDTKWGTYDGRGIHYLRSTQLTERIRLCFSSAWAPPVPVVVALGKLYPECNITLKYYEQGCAYKGTLVIEGGVVVSETEGTYRGNRGG